jgi:PHD/YefM family antitoxin component YafN of YafNO toxin-antitoxin module
MTELIHQTSSIADFNRDVDGYVLRLQQSRDPIVLTVDGRAALVVQDAASYQDMLERLDQAETVAAIRRGHGRRQGWKVPPTGRGD